MKAPDFWIEGGPLSAILAPAGWLWAIGGAFRGLGTRGFKASVPVVCVGNVTAGGQGKTPVAMSLAGYLEGACFLSKGYGGRAEGPLRVEPARHSYRLVGDEPLILAEVAPCWIAKDRVEGAIAATEGGAGCLIMDDGFQDPSLRKDVSFLVVDGHFGFGSGRCIPAGPLREPLDRALRRTDAVVLLGPDRHGVARRVSGLPLLRARLEPDAEAEALAGQRVLAFAGIGQPAKFFRTLDALHARTVASYAFPDHHPYHPIEINELIAEADRQGAIPITTTKDFVRIPLHLRNRVTVLPISVTWDDETQLQDVLGPVLRAKA